MARFFPLAKKAIYGLCSEIAISEALLSSQFLGKKWRVESRTLDLERMFNISNFCMTGKGWALGRRGRRRTEAFIDFRGRLVAFVLWYLYTYSVLLIINGCLSHTSAWWGKDEHWAAEEGRGRRLILENLDLSFLMGPLH